MEKKKKLNIFAGNPSIARDLYESGTNQDLPIKSQLNPIYNSQRLSEHREKLYEVVLGEEVSTRLSHNFEVSQLDKDAFRCMWLKEEIHIIEQQAFTRDNFYNLVSKPSNWDQIELNKYLTSCKKELVEMENRLNPKKPEKQRIRNDYKVGNFKFDLALRFATGEVFKVYEELNGNFTKITERLGLENKKRSYISDTFGNAKRHTNIFFIQAITEAVISYCNKNEISICPEFHTHYNLIKRK